MPHSASDRVRMRARPTPTSRPAKTPRRYSDNGAPVAGAPGWYIVRRRSPLPVLFDGLLRRRPRFGFAAVSAAAGVAVLVLVLSLVRAHWVGAPAERSTTASTPSVNSSPGARPDGSRAASAEAPVAGLTSEPDETVEEGGSRQGASITATSRAKTDPAPPEEMAALSLASLPAPNEWLAPDRQRPPRPLAPAAPSEGGTPSAQVPGAGSRQAPPSSPQGADTPARLGSTAKSQAAGEVSVLEDRPMVSAGEIRVFIHHVAGHRRGTALAQRLAGHLRRQDFTVADIRPVDFSIGRPSVRYFFETDRSASERLVKELGRFSDEAGSPAPDHASDFTHFTPKPRPGNVEVWLPAS
jgi:hypothetical protein